MKSHLRVVGLLAVMSAGMTACGFETSRTVLAPTGVNSSGTPTPVPNGGPGLVTGSANASGQMTSATDMTYVVNGNAMLQNVIPCPFAITGTGHLENPDTLHISYSGDTCLGPVTGQETLRRPKP